MTEEKKPKNLMLMEAADKAVAASECAVLKELLEAIDPQNCLKSEELLPLLEELRLKISMRNEKAVKQFARRLYCFYVATKKLHGTTIGGVVSLHAVDKQCGVTQVVEIAEAEKEQEGKIDEAEQKEQAPTEEPKADQAAGIASEEPQHENDQQPMDSPKDTYNPSDM